MTFENQPLSDRSVLLIEGESFLASYIADGIRAAGGSLCGHARSVTEANELLSQLRVRADAVVADLEIFEADSFEHRDTVRKLFGPLLLISNRARTPMLGHEILSAPFAAYQVVDHICLRLGLEATRGPESRRKPYNF